MLIDCDTCTGRGVHCGDCVIGAFLDPATFDGPPRTHQLDSDEQIAFVALAEAGLLPPLRLVPPPRRNTRGIA